MKLSRVTFLMLVVCCGAGLTNAQQAPPPSNNPAVPEWASPGSAPHKQVAPPADFHRPSRNFYVPLGVFSGQSDVGSAVVEGGASYDSASKQYTIHSAGYN